MGEAELYIALTDIFRRVFSRDGLNLGPQLTARDIQGWDSFKQIDIILAVEEQFSIKFRARELDGLHSVGDLARLICMKVVGR